MVKINLPDSDSQKKQIEECVEIIDKIDKEYLKNKNVSLDLSELKWILSCSALLLSSKIVELKNKGCKISLIPPEDISVANYLSSLGFPLGGGEPRDTFMPIHHFFRKAGENSTKIIETEMEGVFKVIEKNFPSGLITSVSYLIAEMADNIDQHSDFTQGSTMIQFYKKKGHVDICVLDNGITIPGAYEKNKVKFEDDCDALNKAIRGVSTREGEISRGKGLETSKNLVNNGLKGNFYILSRRCLYCAEYDNKPKSKLMEKSFKGTLICMRFKAPEKDLNIYRYIE